MSVDIDRIKALHEAATEGPWEASGNGVHKRVSKHYDECVAVAPKNDAAFIAAARTDLPACVAEIERLRNSLRAAEMVVDAADGVSRRSLDMDSLRSLIKNYNDHCREVPNEAG